MSNRPKGCLPAPRPQWQREQAGELYRSGKTYAEISEALHLPLSTLRNWCKRDNWKLAESKPDLAIVATVPEEPIEPSNLDLAEKQERYQERMGDAAMRLAEHIATLNGEQLVRSADKLLKSDQIARKALKLDTGTPNPVIQIGVLCQPLRSMVRPAKAVTE